MTRTNVEGSDLTQVLLRKGLKMDSLEQTLGANLTMDNDFPPVVFLDPGGASRDVLLPPEEKGLIYFIYNEADAAENLVVKEDSDTTTIVTIAQNEMAILICKPSLSWQNMLGSTAAT